ncbi:MAG: PulJ/GspJ family protein [Pseudomonadota bacterium]
MSQHKSRGFSLTETMVASAIVAIWAVSSQQLLQVGLAAIEKAKHKAQAVEVLNRYIQDAHIDWINGYYPSPEITLNGFIIHSNVNSMDENNASIDVEITWGEENRYLLKVWLSR